jgi:hypothetical protein
MVKAISGIDTIAVFFMGALFIIPILGLFYTALLSLWSNTFNGDFLNTPNIILGIIVISVLFLIFFLSNTRHFSNPSRWKLG